MITVASRAGTHLLELRIHDDDAGQRLDRYLRKLLPNAPLGLLHRLLRQGAVHVDGTKASRSEQLEPGQIVALALDADRFAELAGTPVRPANARPADARRTDARRTDARRTDTRRDSARQLQVVHRDHDLLVVDKPGGLAVHTGTGVGDDHLMARLGGLVASGRARTFRPAPANRIDRGTSGLVVIGLSAAGLRGMAAAFRDRQVAKTYLAIVDPRPDPASGCIDVPLTVRDRGAGTRKAKPDVHGAPARSRYRVRSTHGSMALVEVEIDTGRTHQVRAHLAAIGTPIVGDRRYGARGARGARGALGAPLERGRIALHAHRLRFVHPVDGRTIELTAPLPDDLARLLQRPV